MHIGTRVSSNSRPTRDGTVVDVGEIGICVQWDKSNAPPKWMVESDVQIMGFDPKYDSGVGVIRDGVPMWKKTVVERKSA